MEEDEFQSMFEVEQTHWWFVARRNFVEKILIRAGIHKGKKLRVADIGAGTGGMITFLKQYGDVVGIEPSDVGRRFARSRGVRLQKGRAEKTGLPSHFFDIVCFFDVMYHKKINEKKALREAYRLLKPDGFCIITDCAFQFLYGPHDVFVHARKRYMISELTHVLKQSGFFITYATYTYFLLFPLFAAWRIIEKVLWRAHVIRGTSTDVSPVRPFINSILLWLCSIEAAFMTYLAFPWGSSVALVAQKK